MCLLLLVSHWKTYLLWYSNAHNVANVSDEWEIHSHMFDQFVSVPWWKLKESGRVCNIGYPSETHLKLKSCKILFVHNIHFNNPIILQFCTILLSAKLQNDWTTKTDVMDKWDFVRFKFKMTLGWIPYITQHPWALSTRGPFSKRGLTLIPVWISNHMPSKLWDEITNPLLNFNLCTIWEWINKFIPHIIMDVITYSC